MSARTAVAGEEPEPQPWTPSWEPVSQTFGCNPTPQIRIVNTAGGVTVDYWSRINTAAGTAGPRSGAVWTFPGGYS